MALVKKGKSERKAATRGVKTGANSGINALFNDMQSTGVTPTVKPTNTTSDGRAGPNSTGGSKPTKKTSTVKSGGGGFGQGRVGLGGVSNE